MAFTKVQDNTVVTNNGGASLVVTFTSALTANNLIVVFWVTDSAEGATPAGYTKIGPATGFCNCTCYYKVAAGGETSVTLAQSVSSGGSAYWAEWSGAATASPVDVSALGNSLSAAGGTLTGPAVTTTNANDLILAADGDDSSIVFASMGGGFTLDRQAPATGTGTLVTAIEGNRIVAATGTYTPTYAQASNPSNNAAITVAFKAAAAGGAPVWVPERRRERTATPPLVRRGAVLFDFKPQFNPIRAADSPQQRRAIRGWLRVRGRYIDPPWPQQTAPANPPIAFSPSQRRALRGWLRTRGRTADPPWPQAPPPTNPAITFTPSQRRTVRGWLRTKGRYAEPPWPQATPPANPAIVFNPSQRRTVRGWIRVRGRYADPPMPQAYGPNPAIVVPPSRPRRLQNLFRAIGRRVNYPWPQAVQPPSQDVVLRVGQTVGRWFAGVTSGRWAAGTTVSRWQAGETVSAWKVISQGATMSQTIASASLQYVRAPVAATVNGAAFNPTVDTVQMAFTSTFREPVLADFNAGSWETAGSTYYARCLVGPGGAVALAAGVWFVWVKITDSPEIPVLPAGTLTVTP